MRIILCSLLIIVSLNLSAQWAKKDEVKLIVTSYNQAKVLGLTDAESLEYATCVIGKIEKAIPNPRSAKITMEEAKEIGRKIGFDCLAESKIKLEWSAYSENLIRSYLNDIKEFKILKDLAKEKLIGCVIDKLKLKYPDGIREIPESDAEKIVSACMAVVMEQ